MGRAPLEEARDCTERTLAAGTARISVDYESDFRLPASTPRRRGGLLRPLLKLAAGAGRWAWDRVGWQWGYFCLEGFIEPSRRRHMVGGPGTFSELGVDAKRFTGPAGQPLATLEPVGGRGFVEVWFLLDALRGLKDATVKGDEGIRGTPCRRLAVRVDIARASAAAPDGIRPPSVDRFEDLLDLPLTLWIDGTHVRRVRFDEARPRRSSGPEPWDFGVSAEGVDWSRLPSPALRWRPRGAGP